MPARRPDDLTTLLARWKGGDAQALSEIAASAYGDLHAMASRHLIRERASHTLQATGLVNELYLRLRQMTGVQLVERRQFYALAAQLMRHILVDHARRADAKKRPGRDARVPLHEDMAWVDAASADVFDLEEALVALAALDERKLRAVEYRFILGCTEAETAELLGVSTKTVARDLELSKTWLYRRLRSEVRSGDRA